MTWRRLGRYSAVVTTLVAVGGALAAPAVADPGPPPHTPTASVVAAVPTVGALFDKGYPGKHSCTASVIASSSGNLILTAGHCVSGTAAGWKFVPAYDGASTTDPAPYGVWTVQHAYVAPQWRSRHDTQYDFAVLQLARQQRHGRSVGIEKVTGANVLGVAPRPGQSITDIAYNDGAARPIGCTIPTYRTSGYPAFNCNGYVGGSSGSPWLARIPGTKVRAVRGVIGGLHQGGCYSYTSYSSLFTREVSSVVARAERGSHPDDVSPAGGDGC